MKLAIFDLDNTLLAGDSDHAWGEYLINKGLVNKDVFKQRNDYFFEQYKTGKLDIYEYVAFAAEPLAVRDRAELDELHQEFMTTCIEPIVLPRGLELVRRHKAQGDYCLIITATNHFITSPIAARFGVDDILATELEICDDRFTGKISGVPCFQAGKVDRLSDWMKAGAGKELTLCLDDSVFYSDSVNDVPLLEKAGKAVAVDPDPMLRQRAEESGWDIISLR